MKKNKKHNPIFGSKTLYPLLQGLYPKQKNGTLTYPLGLNKYLIHPTDQYSLASWTKSFLKSIDDSTYNQITIEPNLGVIIEMSWSNKSVDALTMQFFHTEEHTLRSVCSGKTRHNRINYLRFDFHPHARGTLFTEPMPHFHTRVSGSPRFMAIPLPLGNNLITDSFDLIYKNFFPDKWFQWACDLWAQKKPQDFKDLDGKSLQTLYSSVQFENTFKHNTSAQKAIKAWSKIIADEKKEFGQLSMRHSLKEIFDITNN